MVTKTFVFPKLCVLRYVGVIFFGGKIADFSCDKKNYKSVKVFHREIVNEICRAFQENVTVYSTMLASSFLFKTFQNYFVLIFEKCVKKENKKDTYEFVL